MKTPERSTAIARALAGEADGLPPHFAPDVAAIAEARAAKRASRRSEAALWLGFISMIGLCVAGWMRYGAPGNMEWLAPVVRIAASQPWLVSALAGLAIVQGLTFRRRV